jgi:hypothetical protein
MRLIVAAIAIIILGSLPHAKPNAYLSIDPQEWTAENIAKSGKIAATFDTFEPRWVQARPTYDPGPFVVRERTPVKYVATVQMANDGIVELPIAYFPGWVVNAPLEPPSQTGRIRVQVPAGSHTIEARFVRTPMRAAADVVSVVALFMICALFYADVRRRSI